MSSLTNTMFQGCEIPTLKSWRRWFFLWKDQIYLVCKYYKLHLYFCAIPVGLVLNFLFFFHNDCMQALAIKTCNHVCQWIKDVENEIFLLGASPFSWWFSIKYCKHVRECLFNKISVEFILSFFPPLCSIKKVSDGKSLY